MTCCSLRALSSLMKIIWHWSTARRKLTNRHFTSVCSFFSIIWKVRSLTQYLYSLSLLCTEISLAAFDWLWTTTFLYSSHSYMSLRCYYLIWLWNCRKKQNRNLKSWLRLCVINDSSMMLTVSWLNFLKTDCWHQRLLIRKWWRSKCDEIVTD